MEFEISHTATSRICSAKVFLKDFSKFKRETSVSSNMRIR